MRVSILVTGGAGFIATTLIAASAGAWRDRTGFDKYVQGVGRQFGGLSAQPGLNIVAASICRCQCGSDDTFHLSPGYGGTRRRRDFSMRPVRPLTSRRHGGDRKMSSRCFLFQPRRVKLVSEPTIAAAVGKFLARAVLFCFPNVVGVPATQGVLLHFIRRLKKDCGQLQVVGTALNGNPICMYLI
jgi:hypothetical protein